MQKIFTRFPDLKGIDIFKMELRLMRLKEKYPYDFILHYALIYSSVACYTTFVPLYFSLKGFSKSEIGTLLAAGPAIAMMMQPVWGMLGDRAESKNGVLKVMIAGSGVAILLYMIPADFLMSMVFVTIFVFFQGSINAMSDTISLEYLESTKWEYGPVRVAGSVGYAITSVFVGIAARKSIMNIFIMYAAIAGITFLWSKTLPIIKGHQLRENKVRIWELKKNRKLILLSCFNLLIFTTLGYNSNFFSIYYKQMGADTLLIGICMFIQAVSEMPFLLLASSMVRRVGIEGTLILSASVTGLRWLMMYYVGSIYVVPAICVLNGMAYVVVNYCIITYINKAVPKELRASGQILNSLIMFVGTSMVGSLIGGVLSDFVGIRQMYLYSFFVNVAAVIVFGIVFLAKSNEYRHQI